MSGPLRQHSAIVTWWREDRHILPERWVRREDWDLTWLGHVANRYHRWSRWVRVGWWHQYVWPAPPRYYRHGKTTYEWHDLNRWQVRWCRIKGHPNGIVYYSSGLEPNNCCKDCGEDLG